MKIGESDVKSFDIFSQRPIGLNAADSGKKYLFSQTGNFHLWKGNKWTVLNETAVNVKDYGVVGDGITDDYDSIQSLVTLFNSKNGFNIIFPKGTYKIDKYINTGTPLIKAFGFSNASNFKISGNGAIFDIKGNFTRTGTNGTTVGVKFTNCTNFTFEGFELDGNNDQMARGTGATEHGGVGIFTTNCQNYIL